MCVIGMSGGDVRPNAGKGAVRAIVLSPHVGQVYSAIVAHPDTVVIGLKESVANHWSRGTL